jgi:hypothetical protein
VHHVNAEEHRAKGIWDHDGRRIDQTAGRVTRNNRDNAQSLGDIEPELSGSRLRAIGWRRRVGRCLTALCDLDLNFAPPERIAFGCNTIVWLHSCCKVQR